MNTPKTLLLCGYRVDAPPPPGAIDRRLAELRAVGAECVCVLAGESAEGQLRASRRIGGAELAYAGDLEQNLLGNARAGLTQSNGTACFVLPVEIPVPPKYVWDALREALDAGPCHVLQPVDAGHAPLGFGFPLLVTEEGARLLRGNAGLDGLADARIGYRSVVASPAKPL